MAFLSPSKWHTHNSRYTSTLRKQHYFQMETFVVICNISLLPLMLVRAYVNLA